MQLAHGFQSVGVCLYAVGSLTRNQLMGYPVSDMDVCSALLPEAVVELCAQLGVKTIPTGAKFGTITIRMGGSVFEHTTFRKDVYPQGGAHRPQQVVFGDTLELDAFRRDFTVNAIYADVLTAQVQDPTGGMADLAAGVIRATSKDPAVIMRDDALRILRMVRFAAELGFHVEPTTVVAAKANVSGLLDISPERVREELNKILCADMRYREAAPGTESGVVLDALLLLEETGALGAILPELTRGRSVAQREDYHTHDVLEHALHTCACMDCTQNPGDALVLRLAALLHDVGKPEVFEQTGSMHEHDRVGAEIAERILRRLRYPNVVVKQVCELVRHHMFDLNNNAKESTLRTRFAQWGYGHTLLLCLLREADVYGSGIIRPGELVKSAARWRRVLADMQAQGAPFSEAQLNCTGAQLMAWTGLPASPRIGELKAELFLHCARRPKDNTPERLRVLAVERAKQ